MTLDAKQVGRTAVVARRFAILGFLQVVLLHVAFMVMFWSQDKLVLTDTAEVCLLALFWSGTAFATIGVGYAAVATARRERGARLAWLLGLLALVQPVISLLDPGITT